MLRTVSDHDGASAGTRCGTCNRVLEDGTVRLADMFDRTAETLIEPCNGAWSGNKLSIPDHREVRIDANPWHVGLRGGGQHRAIAVERGSRRIRTGEYQEGGILRTGDQREV